VSRRWSINAAMFRLPQLSQTAYELEKVLDEIDPDGTALHALFVELVSLFSVLARTPEAPASPGVLGFLEGKRFAAAGFDEVEALRLSQILEQAHAFVRILDSRPHVPERRSSVYDCIILNALDAFETSLKLATSDIPLIIVGSSCSDVEPLLSTHPEEHDFVLRPWSPSEILFRCYSVTHRSAQARARKLTRAGASKTRVLVGDDDPTTLALIQMTLVNYKMECETASSGGKILEAALQSMPDLVILDINMPELDGFEVLSALKRSEETRHIPVFVLTSRQQETDILRGFSLGAEDYITKPFSPLELVARIKRTMQGPA
jgi:DNA-binding response OmpR family regulator